MGSLARIHLRPAKNCAGDKGPWRRLYLKRLAARIAVRYTPHAAGMITTSHASAMLAAELFVGVDVMLSSS
jgi:hypothetical protein